MENHIFLCFIFLMEMRHLNVKIYGRVQGVFFRHSAKQKAEELKIKGFVRNEPDGAVYIEAEGKENDLKQFLNWCRQGPDSAFVEKIDFDFKAEIKKFDDFMIE